MYEKRNVFFCSVTIILTIMLFSINGVVCAASAKPKDFPNRPITLIVPYSSGGGSDSVTRAIAGPLSKIVGVPVSVVNKPGGAGVAGLADFMMSRKDGYTLVEQFDDCATMYATKKIKWNPTVDYFPLCIAQITFSQIYVRVNDKRFPDWNGFLKEAKKSPELITMANISHKGAMERVIMWQLENALGFKVRQISFQKPAERYASLIGKHVDSLFEQPGDVRAYIESGDMRPVFTMLPDRPKVFADVPCFSDAGLDLVPLYRFRGFFAAKGVPQDRIKYLEWAFRKAWESEAFQKYNKSKYMDVISSYRGIKGGKELIDGMVSTYKEVYKNIGISK